MSIYREKNRQIAAELQAAVNEIAKKHGLCVPVVDMRYARDGSMFRMMKIDFVASDNSDKISADSAEIDNNVPYDLAAAMKRLGITKMVNSKGERLVAYKARRPKYPFTFEGPRGGRWKATEDDVKRMFA